MFNTWLALAVDGTRLGLEAQRVIGLRLMRIASGGTMAHTEMSRMVTEKVTAFAEAATTLAAGGSAQKVIRRYRTHVRANGRRLSRR